MTSFRAIIFYIILFSLISFKFARESYGIFSRNADQGHSYSRTATVGRGTHDLARLDLHPARRINAEIPRVSEFDAAFADADFHGTLSLNDGLKGRFALRSFEAMTESRFAILLSAPEDSTQFRNIFSEEPSAAQMHGVEDSISAIYEAAPSTVRLQTVRDLWLSLRDSERKFVFIVAHNFAGGLMLPDGSTASIRDLSVLCARFEKRCIFLSCNSIDYIPPSELGIRETSTGITGEVSYLDIALVLRAINDGLMNIDEASYQTIDQFIRYNIDTHIASAIASRRLVANARVLLVASGGIGVMIYGLESRKSARQELIDSVRLDP